MTRFKMFLAFLLAGTMFVSSCSKEDESSDLRDNVVGTFNYSVKMYVLNNNSLTYLGAEYDDSGTMIVKKNADNATSIDFFEGGEIMFKGTKIAGATNGIVFDVPSQTMTEDGESYTISGYENWDLGGTKYHGAYINATKKLQIAFKFSTVVDGTTVTAVMLFDAAKVQ